jgi:hypothetical protein
MFLKVLAVCALPAITSCAANSHAGSYAGIPLAAGAAPTDLQNLAHRASAGDKQAQLELGSRYETGVGVEVDLRRAERLYRSAARATGGTLQVYVPPVGKNGRGSVQTLERGPRVRGLPEAQATLRRLTARARSPSPNRSSIGKDAAERLLVQSMGCIDSDGVTNCNVPQPSRVQLSQFDCGTEEPARWRDERARLTCDVSGRVSWSDGRREPLPGNRADFYLRGIDKEERWETGGLYVQDALSQ